MIAETETGERAPKAKRLILTEIVLGSGGQEVVSLTQEETTKYEEERISKQLNSWVETVEGNLAIVVMAVYEHVNFPPIRTYIIVPQLEGKGEFRKTLYLYLKEALPDDLVEEKSIKGISFIVVSGKSLSVMDISQRKMIFGDFIDPSREK